MLGKIRRSRLVSEWLNGFLMRQLAAELRDCGVEKLCFYDLGARWGVWEPIKRVPFPLFTVGVDADPEEAARLESQRVFDRVLPVGLSDAEKEVTLYLAREPGRSSIRKPNIEAISLFCGPDDLVQHEVMREIPVRTTTLESAVTKAGLPEPDFMKVDLEGSDFDIIASSIAMLRRSCSGVLFEGRLSPFHQGEHLVGDTLALLSANGFAPISIQPVGAFQGALMLFDCAVVMNPRYTAEQRPPVMMLKAALFSLLIGNWGFFRLLLTRYSQVQPLRSPWLRKMVRAWTGSAG